MTPTVGEVVLDKFKAPAKVRLTAEKLPLGSRETMALGTILGVALEVTVSVPVLGLTSRPLLPSSVIASVWPFKLFTTCPPLMLAPLMAPTLTVGAPPVPLMAMVPLAAVTLETEPG